MRSVWIAALGAALSAWIPTAQAAWVEQVVVPGFVPEPSFVNSLGMTMVLVPEGRFVMGSTYDERYRHYGMMWGVDEMPIHEVRLSSFYMSAYEVTVDQWRQYVEETGEPPPVNEELWVLMLENPDWPIFYVSWDSARAFYHWLNEREADTIPEGGQYRFPTEAEWEYCCRAGTYTAFHTGDTLGLDQARLGLNPPAGYIAFPADVGSYEPNAFGLFDMHGNVEEWCFDDYYEGFYSRDQATRANPVCTLGYLSSYAVKGPVVRGGSMQSPANSPRSAARRRHSQSHAYPMTGFRLIMIDPRLPGPPLPSIPAPDPLQGMLRDLQGAVELQPAPVQIDPRVPIQIEVEPGTIDPERVRPSGPRGPTMPGTPRDQMAPADAIPSREMPAPDPRDPRRGRR